MPAGQPLLSGHLVCRFRPTPCGQEPPNTSHPHSGVQAHRAHSSPGAPGLLRPPSSGPGLQAGKHALPCLVIHRPGTFPEVTRQSKVRVFRHLLCTSAENGMKKTHTHECVHGHGALAPMPQGVGHAPRCSHTAIHREFLQTVHATANSP